MESWVTKLVTGFYVNGIFGREEMKTRVVIIEKNNNASKQYMRVFS